MRRRTWHSGAAITEEVTVSVAFYIKGTTPAISSTPHRIEALTGARLTVLIRALDFVGRMHVAAAIARGDIAVNSLTVTKSAPSVEFRQRTARACARPRLENSSRSKSTSNEERRKE
jgi:hypothetical protein